LPETLESKTGRGRQLFFATAGAEVRNSAGKLRLGLDVRSAGGYVVLPPSVHPNGSFYEWIRKVPPALLPAWLLAELTAPEARPAGNGEPSHEPIPQGQRNSTLTSLAGTMRRRGLSQKAIEAALLEENRARCQPPLPEADVRRIAGSVGRYAVAQWQPAKDARAARYQPSGPVPVPGVLASELTPKQVQWLWKNRIPLGKVTIFDGDPDLGKSLVTLDLTARLTRGRAMPDGSEAGCPPAGAVIVSLEDDAEDTLRPRLEAAGADLAKVRIVGAIKGADGIERTPTVPGDLPSIEAAIRDVNAKLIVLDPLVATLGTETNSHTDHDIRRALAPLQALAAKTGFAVIAIRHLNKGSSPNPKYRGGGSIGIIGAARAAFMMAEDPDNPEQFIMAPVKGNLWKPPRPKALRYALEDSNGIPCVSWLGESEHTARSLCAQPEGAEETNACAAAKGFLAEILREGPQASKEVLSEARKAGVSPKTLYRAKDQMRVKAERNGGIGPDGHWEWSLPDSPKMANPAAKMVNPAAKMASHESMAILGKETETKDVVSISSSKMANSEKVTILGTSTGHLSSGQAELELTDGPDQDDVVEGDETLRL
jgi:hypothetical protein